MILVYYGFSIINCYKIPKQSWLTQVIQMNNVLMNLLESPSNVFYIISEFRFKYIQHNKILLEYPGWGQNLNSANSSNFCFSFRKQIVVSVEIEWLNIKRFIKSFCMEMIQRVFEWVGIIF